MDPSTGNAGFLNMLLFLLPSSGFFGMILRILLALGSIGTVAGTTGCRSTGSPKSVQEQKATAQIYVDTIRDLGAEGVVQMGTNGRVGLFQQSSIGLDSGLTAQATIIVKPQAQTSEQPSPESPAVKTLEEFKKEHNLTEKVVAPRDRT